MVLRCTAPQYCISVCHPRLLAEGDAVARGATAHPKSPFGQESRALWFPEAQARAPQNWEIFSVSLASCLPCGSRRTEGASAAAGDEVAKLPCAGTAASRCRAQRGDRERSALLQPVGGTEFLLNQPHCCKRRKFAALQAAGLPAGLGWHVSASFAPQRQGFKLRQRSLLTVLPIAFQECIF